MARLEETAQAFVVRNGQLMNGFRDVCVIFQPEKVGHPSRLAVCFLLLNTQIGRQMEKWHRSWCGNDSECVRAVEIWSIFFFLPATVFHTSGTFHWARQTDTWPSTGESSGVHHPPTSVR